MTPQTTPAAQTEHIFIYLFDENETITNYTTHPSQNTPVNRGQ